MRIDQLILPKLSYLFKVEFKGMKEDCNTHPLTNSVSSVELPKFMMLNLNEEYHEPYHEPIICKIKFTDDKLNNVLNILANNSPRNEEEQKFTTIISLLAVEGEILTQYTLYGCSFDSMAYNKFDYSSNNPITIETDIKSKYVKRTI